jgi:regulator of replication initiation timing
MQVEFEALELKLNQLVQLSTRLRAENHKLRQELVTALSYGKQCDEKINTAQSRLERLLDTIPVDEK